MSIRFVCDGCSRRLTSDEVELFGERRSNVGGGGMPSIVTDFDYDGIVCPMPDCESPLHLVWSTQRALYAGDLFDPGWLGREDAHTSTWQVECEEGHVVLLPGPTGCGCENGGGPGCEHNELHDDWDDDSREFQRGDAGRLQQLIATMTAATA